MHGDGALSACDAAVGYGDNVVVLGLGEEGAEVAVYAPGAEDLEGGVAAETNEADFDGCHYSGVEIVFGWEGFKC